MKGSFDHLVVKSHHGQSAATIASASVDTLSGVSASDADHLREAFGIETVGDLAANRFVQAAQAILIASVDPGHDRGPDLAWTAFFQQAPLNVYQAHPSDFRLDFGPVWYRGRLDGTARVLIIGQDPAANELVGHRIFLGASGQRIQGFLGKLGITRDYIMINTFLYPVFGQFFQLSDLSHDSHIQGFRNDLLNRIVEKNPIEVVIAVGTAGKDAIENWPNPRAFPWQHIQHPSARDHAALFASWNAGVTALRAIVEPEQGVAPDMTNYGTDWTDADHRPVPRRDLPFGLPEWHGVGSHASRGRENDGSTDHKAIIWRAP